MAGRREPEVPAGDRLGGKLGREGRNGELLPPRDRPQVTGKILAEAHSRMAYLLSVLDEVEARLLGRQEARADGQEEHPASADVLPRQSCRVPTGEARLLHRPAADQVGQDLEGLIVKVWNS